MSLRSMVISVRKWNCETITKDYLYVRCRSYMKRERESVWKRKKL